MCGKDKFKSALEVVGFSSVRESFLLFLIVGFLLLFFGGFLIDFDKNLPETYEVLMTEPVAFNVFFWMSFLGLISTGVIGLFKGEPLLQRVLVTRYTLAMSRTGLVAGAIISGMFTGMTLAFCCLSVFEGHESVIKYAVQFFPLALQTFMFLCVFTIAHAFLLIPCGGASVKLKVWTIVLSVLFFGIALGILACQGAERQLLEVSVLCCVLQLTFLIVNCKCSSRDISEEPAPDID